MVLRYAEEDAMITFPIIDAHVHLWDPARFRMPWLEEVPAIKRPYELDDYLVQTAGLPIEGIIYVEVDVPPEDALREAQWIVDCAQRDARIRGVVAAAPIEKHERLRTYLETLVALDSRIKGVRRNLQGETAAGFCLQPAFVEGIQMLSEYDLSFDLCLIHTQMPDVIQLVRLCPETRFILDHLGKPGIRGHMLDPWREHIRELASCPNVMCKLSGMVTEADHQQWVVEDLAPYVAHILDAFGEDRVLFGSDWPVMLLATTYPRWVQVLDDLTAYLTPAAKRKLWSENARRCYRLHFE